MKKITTAELQGLLLVENSLIKDLNNTEPATSLKAEQRELAQRLASLFQDSDLEHIIAIEKTIVKGDLERYANTPRMVSSLKKAVEQLELIEYHLALVDDPQRYHIIDESHRLNDYRYNDVPKDHAHHCFASHLARLGNMDKSRLTAEEKKIIHTRQQVMQAARKTYEQRQRQSIEKTH